MSNTKIPIGLRCSFQIVLKELRDESVAIIKMREHLNAVRRDLDETHLRVEISKLAVVLTREKLDKTTAQFGLEPLSAKFRRTEDATFELGS